MAERRVSRKLAAILATDVVGYSRLMEADEAGTLAQLKAIRKELIDAKIAEFGGRIVKTTGDGMLVEFPSAVDAVKNAVETQKAVAERNAEVPEEQRLVFRVGVNLGDVIVDGDDLHGDGINVAARLEELCDPGGVAISGTVHEHAAGKLDYLFTDAGEHQVKNIARPIRVWRWSLEADTGSAATARPASEPLPLPDKPSIAVLPFDNLSGDPEQAYFVDGITEDIITTLSKVPQLFVIARNSTFVYKGRAVDVKQVAAEQGVRYVLEGSVRKAGNRVRISAQLIDASGGHHLWADRYDGDLDDVFALQDEITQEIVTALEVTLTDGEQARIWRHRAGSADVYDHFIRGRELYLTFSKATNAQARAEYEKAIAINPDFALACAHLGYTYAEDGRRGWVSDPEAALDKATELTEQARSLDRTSSHARTVRAYVHMIRGEHGQALALMEEAIGLNPSGAEEFHVYAMILNLAGQPHRAIGAEEQALRLSPLDRTNYLVELGHAYCLVGRYGEAVEPLERVLEERPRWLSVRVLLALAYAGLGRAQAAADVIAAIRRDTPGFSVTRWLRMFPYTQTPETARHVEAMKRLGLPE
jgi:TolB-like protein